MANNARAGEKKKNEQERDIFCAVSDAFRSFAHRSSILLGSAWAFCGAVLVIVVWLVTGPTFHFSDTWQLIINTATTIITFLLVALLQNTQTRNDEATQDKLNALAQATALLMTHFADVHDRGELRDAVTELRDAVGLEDEESA